MHLVVFHTSECYFLIAKQIENNILKNELQLNAMGVLTLIAFSETQKKTLHLRETQKKSKTHKCQEIIQNKSCRAHEETQ